MNPMIWLCFRVVFPMISTECTTASMEAITTVSATCAKHAPLCTMEKERNEYTVVVRFLP